MKGSGAATRTRIGVMYAIGAYVLWGLLPFYWKALQSVSAFEILCHRMVWSLLFVAALLLWGRNWGWIAGAIRSPRTLATFVATALILGVNWFIYIWAVNAGFIVETSLGYFINPLLSVLLGVIVLGERLRVGTALLEVSQPRFPCFKLGLKMGDASFPKRFLASGLSGFYLRVIEQGELEAGSTVERVSVPPETMTIAETNDVSFGRDPDSEALSRLMDNTHLAPQWKDLLRS